MEPYTAPRKANGVCCYENERGGPLTKNSTPKLRVFHPVVPI